MNFLETYSEVFVFFFSKHQRTRQYCSYFHNSFEHLWSTIFPWMLILLLQLTQCWDDLRLQEACEVPSAINGNAMDTVIICNYYSGSSNPTKILLD